jgi:hypothetical protein
MTLVPTFFIHCTEKSVGHLTWRLLSSFLVFCLWKFLCLWFLCELSLCFLIEKGHIDLASFEKPFPSHNHLFLLLDLLKTSFYCVFADFHSLLSEIFSYRSEHDIVCLFLYLLTPVLSLFLAFIFLLFWSWGECFYIEGFSNIWKSCVAWRDF